MNHRILLACSTAIVVVMAAPQVSAQTAPREPGATQIEEVIVTAQRRSESAQRAAISVDAVTAEELQNVGTNPGDLTRVAPSVQFFQSSNVYPQTSIRGIGNATLNPTTDATVGFNYDGVPITRVAGSVGLYYDLQRVEVLKGPQGTLYGRNQTGGTVNIIPNAPIMGERSGNLTVEAGNFNLKRINGALNVPLNDRVAMRAAFNIIDREGYYNSGLSDDVGQSGRLIFKVEPTEAVTLQLGLDYHHQGGKGGGTTLLNSTFASVLAGPPPYRQYNTDGKPLGGDPWIDVNDRCDGVDRSPTSTGSLDWDDWFYTTGANSPCRFDGKMDNTFFGVTGLAEVDLWGGTLTVIPALRTTDLNSITVGGTNLVNQESSESYTLEARYASNEDARFSYIVGGFLLDDSDDANFQILINFPNNSPTRQVINSTTKSWAAFASARLNVTDDIRLTSGLRYTHDDKTFGGTSTPAAPPSLTINSEKDWSEVTYNLGAEWDIAPDSLLYLTYGRGYKAGGFFFATPFAGFGPGATGATPTTVVGNSYEPEYVNAITLGSKNRFFDRRLLLNFEVFKYEYKDQQLSQFGRDDWIAPFGTPNAYAVSVFLTTNIGSVDILGQELESQFLVTDNTLLSLNVQHLDTEISGSLTNQGLNTAGYPAQQAPDWSATLGIEQKFPLSNGAELVANLRGQYRSESWVGSSDYLPYMLAEAVTTGDVSLTYDSGAAWRLTGYVNNFTDEDVPAFYAGTGAARGSAAGPPSSAYTAQYRPPRTFGVRLGVNF